MKFLATLILLALTWSATAAEPATFEEQVDMSSWSDGVAVFTDGRVKSYETFARSFMPYIMGPRKFENQSATFTYIDMMVRPDRYLGKSIIYVKHKGLRAKIIHELVSTGSVEQFQMEYFMKSGLVSREILLQHEIRALFNNLRQDVRRFASPIEQIDGAISASDPRNLWASLRLVPPASGSFDEPWTTLEGTTSLEVVDSWERMVVAWEEGNAAKVNAELVILSTLLPDLAKGADIYPPATKLRLESLYFRLGNLTSIWLVYLVSTVLLLMAFVYRFKKIGQLGIAIFILAVMLHTLAVLWRWRVSGRYPNTNMFEAITTASWMGGLFGIIMLTLLRRNAMKYVFPLGASVAAMVALLAVRLYPLELNPHISNKMPVLHDVWLYIHVNFIIFSYCLIFVAAVAACLYLIRRLVQKFQGRDGTSDFARAGGVASLVEVKSGNKAVLTSNLGVILDGATMVLVEISFILLWTGLVMGAIWADHSWGRPWGWDPKEVFALNTFLIFAVLIHVRGKVKDKGMWTAMLALAGCGVMLFNWIIINFTISGLHSYA
jgi:cytochrome c-type biogenesis protein CcsB